MHVVHVVRQFHPAVGGMENVVWELARAQTEKGHSVRVVTLDRMFETPSERLNARERTHGFEIVRVPFFGSNRYPLAWQAIRHLRGADIVHVHGLDFFFDYLAWTRWLHRRKLVVSTHGGYFHTPFAAAMKKLYFRTITRLSLSAYGGVATVSEPDQKLFQSVRTGGVRLIENGINIEKFRAASASWPAKSIISLGRFSVNKRLDRLIEFIAALRQSDPDWTLKIVGRPGDLTKADLEALAEAQHCRDAVEVVILPSDATIRRLMGECSVIASASIYEGFGLSAVEGMSAGLFPLLSDIPPFHRLLAKHNVGMLVDFEHPGRAAERFRDRWHEISERHEHHRRRSVDASAQYCWSRVSEQYEVWYDAVLGNRTRSILDVPVGVSTFNEAMRLLDDRFANAKMTMIVFANAHTINNTCKDEKARDALSHAIVFNDGIGVNLASRLLFGKWFPENLNGTDFVPDFLRHTRHRLRIFFLGAKPGVAERAAAYLMGINSAHELAGCSHGYRRKGDTERIIEEIRRGRADVLFVALGDPMQELWLQENLAKTGCRFGFAVGGLFDFMAAEVPRAPSWMRALQLEWLYRLTREPRRLWHRYLVEMPVFLLRVAGQWLAGPRVTNAER